MEDTNKAVLEEMLRDVEKADEPGGKQRVISDGEGDLPPMVTHDLRSAGYSILYDTKTGIPSLFNNNMLRTKIMQKRKDGSFIWDAKQLVKPKVFAYKCLLHSSDPNREHYDDVGLKVCPKENLASPYEVRRHMQKRHKVEWEAIEAERIDREKAEDREFQRMLITSATNKPELYVSDKDKMKTK